MAILDLQSTVTSMIHITKAEVGQVNILKLNLKTSARTRFNRASLVKSVELPSCLPMYQRSICQLIHSSPFPRTIRIQ